MDSKSKEVAREELYNRKVALSDSSGLNIGYEDIDFSDTDEEIEENDIVEWSLKDVVRRPLSRKIPIPSSRINPYRMVILMRSIAMVAFFYFRLKNPVQNGYVLWSISVICEMWFALAWILDQLPKWFPVNRETYRHRLALRYDRKVEQLASIDIVITTFDPTKEPPIVTANCVLSVLSVDYPVDKVSCYVSDDGASFLTYEGLHETAKFARKWVPFCKRHSIEPRAPEYYFSQKVDYLRNKVQATFVKERRVMKREYEEFKVRINALVAKVRRVPKEGWFMRESTPWPGNRTDDHPAIIQVILGECGEQDAEIDKLPRLVYVSRENCPGFRHHNKAGAMNALVRLSAVLTNGAFLLNLNCVHYVSNSKILQEAMCFLLDPNHAKSLCFVQFPLRFHGIGSDDLYANRNTAFFDIHLRALDGIQGPTYIGTGCIFNRTALYGYEAPIKPKHKLRHLPRCFRRSRESNETKIQDCEMGGDIISGQRQLFEDDMEETTPEQVSQLRLEKLFGHSYLFIESTLLDGVNETVATESLLKEAIKVISCGYEDDTRWGREIGWIYGSGSEDFLTGLKMHARGWRSIYCMPKSPAIKAFAPSCLADRLHQVRSWAQGSIRILLSRHCPIWYALGGRLKWLQRLAYINYTVYPLTAVPLAVYCSLPAICLITGKFIFPKISFPSSITLLGLFLTVLATNIMEMRWSGVGINEWWRNEQFWVIGSISAHLVAIVQGFFKSILANVVSMNFHSSPSCGGSEEFPKPYEFKWTMLLIPPTTLLMVNLIGILVGISYFIDSDEQAWSLLFCKVFFSLWVIIHLYPFLKGLTGQQDKVPTIVVVWSILLASSFSLIWANTNLFISQVHGPSLDQCGINC